MNNDRASCHSSDHSQDSLTDKLSALLQRSGLFGLTDNQNKSKTSKHSIQCGEASSPFALPTLELIETGKAGNDEQQKNIDDSISKLQPVVEHEKLSKALLHLAKLPQTEKVNFLRSLNSIIDDDSKTSNLATRKLIVNELVDQINHPEKIKQGFKGTCGLAAVEVDIATSRPDIYAQAVARWSKMIDTNASTKDDVAAAQHSQNVIIDRDDESHHRTLVSRIFQTGAANLMLAGSGKRYESFTPAEAPEIKTPDGSYKPDSDTGERVLDATGKVFTWEGVGLEEQASLLTELTSRHFTADKIYPTSPQDLVAKLKGELAKSDAPINLPLHSVEGEHAITVVKIGDQDQSANVFYLNTASSKKRILQMSAQKLYDTTIDGDDVVRIGSAEEIDGLTFRKPYKLPANASPFVSVVHGD